RQYYASRDALRSHRQRHQTALLAELRASPDAWTMAQVWGEIWRLHQIGWDELAKALRGEVVGFDGLGQPVRRVSSKAVSLMLEQVRKNLDLMARTAGFRSDKPRDSRARRTAGSGPASPRRSSRERSSKA